VVSTRCLNDTCVRHLRVLDGTEGASVANKARVGRHYDARLDREQVIQIRELYRAGEYTQRELAERFHVSPVAVSQIICGRTYRDI
jgi:DNA-binding MarR family transcriptional regulator